ncbi:hypothetical protein [Pedobacter metabolipauper]|uniref:Uncharacterized protein n=1 Tax=Pedobacter metabolipauper TaxID=425513 RepID=A0A4R6T2H3_9SPHI|nr:hypothetical protein [Pedobacter metabolipauper]TDQ11541.1 hypothetical protein ATK78_0664 [Pedobacter metabolipauper]
MNLKSSLFFLLFISSITAFSQTQTGLLKDPEWKVFNSMDSKSGAVLRLSNHTTAMIVSIAQEDFAVLNIDDKLTQKWFKPLSGYPLSIGKFKNNILVIAASDKSLLKRFSGSYKAYILDEKTGNVLLEKVIYEGNPDFIEDPDFFFAKDGSYMRMSVRLTLMKRNTIKLFNTNTKDFRTTQGYSIIDFDDQLNQRQKINPEMPFGDVWTTSSGTDGSFFIAAVDQKEGKINTSTYMSSSAKPLKSVSIPFDVRKNSDIESILSISGNQTFTNYLSIVYTNLEKETTLLTAKINFKDATFKTTTEVFDNKHFKELEKTFIPANKKYDDLQFNKKGYLNVSHMEEYDSKLMVSISCGYIMVSTNSSASVTIDGSLLLNFYDQELKELYHQFIPRTYISPDGEGAKVAYFPKNNTLRIIANMKATSLSSVSSIYAEMDLSTGKMLKTNKIADEDIKKGYYANTKSVIWFDESCILPYLDRQRILSSKLGLQIQQLSF